MVFLDFLYGIFLGVAHFISDKIAANKGYKIEVRSLAAGLSLTYLLIYLLPEIYAGVAQLDRYIFLFVLLGAVSLHLVEKYLYQHKKSKKLLFDLRVVHALFFFVYHFVIGIVIVAINALDVAAGFLFFVPILFYTAVSQVSLHQLHANITEKLTVRLILSASTLFGIALATIFLVPELVHISLLAFVAGALLYNVMVEVIPRGKEGNMIYFIFGAIIYIVLIFLLGGF